MPDSRYCNPNHADLRAFAAEVGYADGATLLKLLRQRLGQGTARPLRRRRLGIEINRLWNAEA